MSAHLPPDRGFPEPEYNALVGPWRVRERIGIGSHGVVFRVVHADKPLAGSFALKLALRAGDPRFEREAHLLSRVHHASVPRFESQGTWKSPAGEVYPYIVMQWVQGLNLYASAAEHGLSVRKALNRLAQVARALEATHAHGVHRDVKGANLRVTSKGHVMLLDFGSCNYPGASPITHGGMPPVTPEYRSPQLLMLEFAKGLGSKGTYTVQPADDVYALGITAYRLLAGVYPPRDSDGTARAVAPRGLNEVCPELGELIVRMLAEDPPARGSAGQIAAKLERLLKLRRPALDKRWVANASQQSTERARRPVPLEDAMRDRASLFVLAGGCVLVGVLFAVLPRDEGRAEWASAEAQGKPHAAQKPDAGTSVGEEATASVAPVETPPDSEEGYGRAIPDTPLPGQKLAPCTQRAAKKINGACWSPVEGERAPCHPTLYEHDGRCYTPVLNSSEQRVPTSNEPE